MRKTGSKRGFGYDSGLLSGVLTAPEESCLSETVGQAPDGPSPELRNRDIAARPAEQRTLPSSRNGPAPAGAYQRGFGAESQDGSGTEATASAYEAGDEEGYVPRRGRLKVRFRGLPRSTGGRIVFASLAFVLLAALVMAWVSARAYLMRDPRFVLATSDDVQIAGAEHLSRDQVLNVFAPDLARSIFRVPLGERRAALEQLPWVAHATVMRLLPDVLRVNIAERIPVAFVRQGTEIGLVDSSGVLLDMPPEAAGDPRYSFPVLTGISALEPLADRAAKIQVYLQFMRALDGAGQHLTESVSEVDISDPEDLRALITSGGSDVLVHFGQEHFLKRYQEFEQHLPEWRQAYPRLASVDMRYQGQIVLGMQGGGGTAAGGVAQEAAAGVAPAASIRSALPPARNVKPAAASSLRRPAARVRGAKRAAGSGRDAANERVFAELSQARRAALSQTNGGAKAKSERANRRGAGGNAGGNAAGTPVRSRAAGASGGGSYGVTP
ncbi:MAG: cell division protein FtsQ/DivIB [Acidobacteriota bacterium]